MMRWGEATELDQETWHGMLLYERATYPDGMMRVVEIARIRLSERWTDWVEARVSLTVSLRDENETETFRRTRLTLSLPRALAWLADECAQVEDDE